MHGVYVEVPGEAVQGNYVLLAASGSSHWVSFPRSPSTALRHARISIQHTLSLFLHLLQLRKAQRALGRTASPALVRERSSKATFSASRCKATQDSHKGLCHGKIWMKNLRLVER